MYISIYVRYIQISVNTGEYRICFQRSIANTHTHTHIYTLTYKPWDRLPKYYIYIHTYIAYPSIYTGQDTQIYTHTHTHTCSHILHIHGMYLYLSIVETLWIQNMNVFPFPVFHNSQKNWLRWNFHGTFQMILGNHLKFTPQWK